MADESELTFQKKDRDERQPLDQEFVTQVIGQVLASPEFGAAMRAAVGGVIDEHADSLGQRLADIVAENLKPFEERLSALEEAFSTPAAMPPVALDDSSRFPSGPPQGSVEQRLDTLEADLKAHKLQFRHML